MKIHFSEKKTDYPKKCGDLQLAWYNHGQICISRKKQQPKIQKQNIHIKTMNRICKNVWSNLLPAQKRDMSLYAVLFKKTWPGLRKRGISSYSVLLMIVFHLIHRYQFNTGNQEACSLQLLHWISRHSLYQMIQIKILKKVDDAYLLNYSTDDCNENLYRYERQSNERLYLSLNQENQSVSGFV
ncbi:MAG TPA: hypothetical protein PKJ08_08525 [Candidatus Cloacimonadota bacterium]|nr:hypothetical protein [Candidatus Cloacimonadota bacterium]HPM01538.1 hypothetical protein [Candidatus Cloacimonadota bacterium]